MGSGCGNGCGCCGRRNNIACVKIQEVIACSGFCRRIDNIGQRVVKCVQIKRCFFGRRRNNIVRLNRIIKR